MNRISVNDIERHIEILNVMFKFHTERWRFDKSEKRLVANVGTFYLYHDLTGYRLEQVCNKHGGASDRSPIGTKREAYDYVRAMIQGVELYKLYCIALSEVDFSEL